MSKKQNKTILVGIDYTKSSANALNYAALLAERSNLPITLFHVYDIPIVHTYSGAFFVSYNQLEADHKAKLEKYKAKVQASYPKLNFLTLVTYRSVKPEIELLLKGHKLFCVVLGMETKSRLSKFIYGSTGTDVAGKVNCPVIIVPQAYKKHHLKNIAFTVDNKKSFNAKLNTQVTTLAANFKSNVNFVHVHTPEEFSFGKTNLPNGKPKIHIVKANNFASGISLYTKEKKMDMVIIVSHSHSMLYNLFNESNTKTIAFRSKIPILAIHE